MELFQISMTRQVKKDPRDLTEDTMVVQDIKH